jgi:hypothetical protein
LLGSDDQSAQPFDRDAPAVNLVARCSLWNSEEIRNCLRAAQKVVGEPFVLRHTSVSD